LLGFSSAYAFHSGGVAECGGCHAMHKADSSGNVIGATNTQLLVGSNVNSTCASTACHAAPGQSSYHIQSFPLPAAGVPPYNRTPGGDFAWLSKSYSFVVRGTTTVANPGGHGLNIPDLGINNEGTGNSPGGSFPAVGLACSSCHDPHGKARTDANGNLVAQNAFKVIGSGSYPTLNPPATGETNSAYGTYRLLYTDNSYYTTNYSGPVPATIAGGFVQFSTAPLAIAPATYNQGENVNQVIVRYGAQPNRTFGRWCASCHVNMHNTLGGKLVHPIDTALSLGGENGYYNSYVNSGNHSGAAATSYLSLVPFATDSATRAGLASGATNTSPTGAGPNAADQVMCLSCHRAHASGFGSALRWEYDGEFITYVTSGTNNATWPGTDTTPQAPQFARGKTAAETQAAYYDRPVSQFGAYQRSLCNKCHAQD
jgi:hypothetical protein